MRKVQLTIPEITAADRAAGLINLPVMFRDGHTEVLTVYRPDPACMVEIFKMDRVTQKVYATVGYALREDVAFVVSLHDKSIAELFLAAHGLESEAMFLKALSASGEIGQMMINENLPGGPANPSQN